MRRGLFRLAVVLALMGLPLQAQALPLVISAVLSVGLELGSAFLISYATQIATALVYGAILTFGVVSSKNAQRRAANNARDAYNNSLTDRTTSIMSADAPWQIIYGEAVVGGAVTAILTSGDKDQFKHMVVVWAAHECTAIVDTLLAGVSIGGLDSNGYVISGKYLKGTTDTVSEAVTLDGSGRARLSQAAARIVVMTAQGTGPLAEGMVILLEPNVTLEDVGGGAMDVVVAPAFVAEWAGKSVVLSLDRSTGEPMLRVRHHLGAAGQTADAALLAEVPGDWSASDKGEGLCYSVFTFNLNEPEFQGGPPQVTVKVRGKKLLNHRTSATAWSDNPGDCTADFLQAEYGKKALSTQMMWAGIDAAANVCDEALSSHAGAKRFTCNGAFRTDQDPDTTLDQLCQSMAGFASFTGAWYLQAGAYSAPVMDLGDADNRGSIEGVAAPQGTEVYNGLRGKFYDPARYDQLTDYPPYQNAAFVSEDGEALWSDLSLPFTNTAWRAHNLARIQVERSRARQFVYPAKRRAMKLRIGHRVRLSNSVLGMVNSVFRVVKREVKLGGPVLLTLAQDDVSYYDEVDAPASLPSPSAYLNDPFVVDAVEGLAATSGTATLLLQADGTVLGRVRVAVTASTDALVTSNGALQIEYRRDADAAWQRAPEASGSASVAYLLGLEEGRVYVLRARWRNGIGAFGDWRSTSVLHLGKGEAPAEVIGLSAIVIPGAVRITRTRSTELDFARTIYRYGASFTGGTAIPGQADDGGITWAWPALGSYTIWAADVDTTGNAGAAVSTPVTVDSSLLITGAGITPPPGWINANAGATNQIDVGWWKQDASIPWTLNGTEQNQIINCAPGAETELPGIAGPKGGNDAVWYCKEVNNDSNQGGGWTNVPLSLDPTRTYRFVVPIRRRSGTDGVPHWGVGGVENLNGDLVDSGAGLAVYNSNPYFAVGRPAFSDRWYLFIGHVYPAGSVQNTSDNAGIFDCKTGAKVADGTNFRFVAGNGNVIHRAYQFYASDGAEQLFGRPMVNLIDGTEPSLREYFEPGAVLNSALVPSITAAQDAADAAQSTATSAGTNATTALTRLAAIDSDGVLSRGEKPEIIKAWQAISDEYTGIASVGTAYGLTSLVSAYVSAVNSLSSYLSGLSPVWSDTSQDTTIVPAVDRAYWAAVYSTRQALLDAIASAAGTVASWAGVTGSGKPENNATRNKLFKQDTDPAAVVGAVVDGDRWQQTTSGVVTAIYDRVSGAWSTGPSGPTGAPGASVYTASVYLQTGTAPSTPTGGSYNFNSGVLTPPSGWSATQPATTTTPTYLAEYTFSTTTPATTVSGGTWTAPVVDAVAGSSGASGGSVFTVEIYQQTGAGTPSTPSGGTYTFSSDSLTPPSGWTRNKPASSTTPTYRCGYTFSTTTPATSVTAGTWSAPVVVAQNGLDGQDAIAMTLSAASVTLPADSTGLVSDYSPATTTAKVMRGATDDTSSWSFSRTNGSGVSSSLSDAVLTVSAMSGDTGYVDITATRTGYATQTARFSLSKAKSAAPAAGVVQIIARYVEDATISPINPYATLKVNADGTWDDGSNWYYGGTPPGGIYARVDIVQISSGGGTSTIGTFGTFLPCSSAPTWKLTRTTVGFSTAFVNISFAADSGGATLLGTGTGQLSATKDD